MVQDCGSCSSLRGLRLRSSAHSHLSHALCDSCNSASARRSRTRVSRLGSLVPSYTAAVWCRCGKAWLHWGTGNGCAWHLGGCSVLRSATICWLHFRLLGISSIRRSLSRWKASSCSSMCLSSQGRVRARTEIISLGSVSSLLLLAALMLLRCSGRARRRLCSVTWLGIWLCWGEALGRVPFLRGSHA